MTELSDKDKINQLVEATRLVLTNCTTQELDAIYKQGQERAKEQIINNERYKAMWN